MYDYVCDVIFIILYLHHIVYGQFLYKKIAFMVIWFDHSSWRDRSVGRCVPDNKGTIFSSMTNASTYHPTRDAVSESVLSWSQNWPRGCAVLATAITWLLTSVCEDIWNALFMNTCTREVSIRGIVGAATRICDWGTLRRFTRSFVKRARMFIAAVGPPLWRLFSRESEIILLRLTYRAIGLVLDFIHRLVCGRQLVSSVGDRNKITIKDRLSVVYKLFFTGQGLSSDWD
jgi:hypothetical protein